MKKSILKTVLGFMFTLWIVTGALPGLSLEHKAYAATEFLVSDFAGGSGTVDLPYEISTVGQLQTLSSKTNSGATTTGLYFILTDNIDLASIATWTPIGTSSNSFKGNFDGNNKIISNLRIGSAGAADSTFRYAGLFGYISGARVENTGLSGCTIYSSYSSAGSVGCLVGYSMSSTITGCYVEGSTVAGTSSYIGGLVGTSYTGSSIDSCYAKASVAVGDGNIKAGGLVAITYQCSISNSYAEGSVSGGTGTYLGGFMGYTNTNSTSITNCYATGNVSGGASSYVGGFAGQCSATGTITNIYAKGNISGGSGALIGGLISYRNSGNIASGYWNSSAIHTLDTVILSSGSMKGVGSGSSSCTAKALSEMQQAASFINLLNANSGGTATWKVVSGNNGCPVIDGVGDGILAAWQEQSAPTGLTGISTTYGGSDGSITGTTTEMEYKLKTADESTYASCSDGATTDLSAGIYSVRYAAREGYMKSEATEVTVKSVQADITYDSITKTYGDVNFTYTASGGSGSGVFSYTSSDTSVAAINSSNGIVTILNVGSVVLTATRAGDGTYLPASRTAILTINKKALTATVADNVKIYGEENPTFTVTVTGFVKGETAATAAGFILPTASSTATATTDAGTATITISGGTADNF